ncbi:MAG: hypothetical protein LBI27_03195, partial [Clostridiales bacterium]|nr:hypothetical protein [Clostridiales bacterium]
ALILTLAIAFAACGGGNDTDTTPSTPVAEQPAPEPQPEPAPEPDPIPEPEPEPEPVDEGIPGIHAGFSRDGDGSSSVTIVLGSGEDVWPFAVGEDDETGPRAFEPLPGRTYRLTYNVTSDTVDSGATAWRVRWANKTGYPPYTAGDGAVVNDFPVSVNDVATVVPAHFNSDIEAGGTYDLVVEVTLDPDQAHDELIGNITLRGGGGSSEWFCNTLVIELLAEGPGSDVEETLVEWSRR